jgi:hypothetical protein
MGGRQKKKAAGGKHKQKHKKPTPTPTPELESAEPLLAVQEFLPGDAVIISGLQEASEHNGKRGVVVNHVGGTGRYRVELDGSTAADKSLGFKACNLEHDRLAAALTGMDISFEEQLLQMKEEEQAEKGQLQPAVPRKKKEAVLAAEEDWESVDTSVQDLLRACEAHASLWVRVDKLTPIRDEWHARWEECEAMALNMTALETRMAQADGARAPDRSE